MTSLAGAVRAPREASRRMLAAGTFALLGLIDILVFGHFASHGEATFALALPEASVHVPSLRVPAAATAYAVGAVSLALAVTRAAIDPGKRAKRTMIATVLLCFLGALAGCLCERSGVINIAIEGQLLLGAFGAAVVASAFGVLWLGLICGSLAGGLLGVLLAVFAIR